MVRFQFMENKPFNYLSLQLPGGQLCLYGVFRNLENLSV